VATRRSSEVPHAEPDINDNLAVNPESANILAGNPELGTGSRWAVRCKDSRT
jgi:hypothetical protein